MPECSLGQLFDLTEDHENWQRVATLRRWNKRGGILILSYTVFKQMILNCSTSGPMFEDADAEEVKHEALKKQFVQASNIDQSSDKIEHLEDQLLTDVLSANRDDVLSVEKTESFHIDEENELDDADELDIIAKREAFWLERKRRALEEETAQALAEANLEKESVVPDRCKETQ